MLVFFQKKIHDADITSVYMLEVDSTLMFIFLFSYTNFMLGKIILFLGKEMI
jgi:hypothetical protein